MSSIFDIATIFGVI